MEPNKNQFGSTPKFDYAWEKELMETPQPASNSSSPKRARSKDKAYVAKLGKAEGWEAASAATGILVTAKSKKAAVRKARKAGK